MGADVLSVLNNLSRLNGTLIFEHLNSYFLRDSLGLSKNIGLLIDGFMISPFFHDSSAMKEFTELCDHLLLD